MFSQYVNTLQLSYKYVKVNSIAVQCHLRTDDLEAEVRLAPFPFIHGNAGLSLLSRGAACRLQESTDV